MLYVSGVHGEPVMSTRIEVDSGLVTIHFDGQQVSLPSGRIETYASVVEAAKLLASGLGTKSLLSAASTATRIKSKPRRSRKKVSSALAAWMAKNPGWHSEPALLETVVKYEMTDANPKRALKIALGRQRDKVFATDGAGHWRLKVTTP